MRIKRVAHKQYILVLIENIATYFIHVQVLIHQYILHFEALNDFISSDEWANATTDEPSEQNHVYASFDLEILVNFHLHTKVVI